MGALAAAAMGRASSEAGWVECGGRPVGFLVDPEMEIGGVPTWH